MTYQRRAYEEVTIEHGGNVVVLRPSLRAAATLEARHGFPAIFRGLDELNLTIIADTILTASSTGQGGAAFLRSEAAGRPLSSFFLAVKQPLTELVSMFVPAPVQSLDTAPRIGKPLPWADLYRDLYDVATGWLGWTPEQAWNATPTEITRAYAAHIEKLKAIHGSTDEDKPAKTAPDPEQAKRNIAAGLDPEFDRAGLQALKAKIASN